MSILLRFYAGGGPTVTSLPRHHLRGAVRAVARISVREKSDGIESISIRWRYYYRKDETKPLPRVFSSLAHFPPCFPFASTRCFHLSPRFLTEPVVPESRKSSTPPLPPAPPPLPSSQSREPAGEKSGKVVQLANSSKADNSEKTNGRPSLKPTVEAKKEGDMPMVVAEPKKTLWQKIKAELVHYYHGFRLLGLEVKITSGIVGRLMIGKPMTRRERKQLVRTVADLFRLVPFAVFIIVPFMELLLPFYLKFFPFMLPSTFQEKQKEEAKTRQLLKGKLEMAKFLQDTLEETAGVKKTVKDAPTVNEFKSFLSEVRESGRLADTKDIVRFSRLFEDEITLESLEHGHLKALCKLLELNSIGPSNLLRFQLYMRVRQLKTDDKMIAKEGVDKLPIWELQTLCRERGMRALGCSEERLRIQLAQWLDLHLEQNIPIALLLLSRAMYVPDALTTEQQLQQAIGRLPAAVSQEVALKVAESAEAAGQRIDAQVKFDVLKKEEESIRLERQSAKAAEEAAKKVSATTEAMVDKAPVVSGLPGEDLSKVTEAVSPALAATRTKQKMVPLAAATVPAQEAAPSALAPEVAGAALTTEPVITAGDLAQIESAIVNYGKTALHEEQLNELKEDVAVTTAAMETKDSKVTKAAGRLGDHVNLLIADMNMMIENLHHEQTTLQRDIEVREGHVQQQEEAATRTQLLHEIKESKARMIDINDLLVSLRRIQKVPDNDNRWQQILDVLDEDHDGKIELHHVVAVIELLGSDNVKMTSKDVSRVLDTMEKEAQTTSAPPADPSSPTHTTAAKSSAPSDAAGDKANK